MQRESVLVLGANSRIYHRLKAELRGTCYRLLRAKNERVAKWLMERVKIGLSLVVDAADDSLERSGVTSQRLPSSGNLLVSRPTLVISRSEHVEDCEPLDVEEQKNGLDCAAVDRTVQELSAGGIPILRIVQDCRSNPERTLLSAINQGADYILFAPYEQTELVQAIRTAMLNGPAERKGEPDAACLEIALHDRMCSLHASREQAARLFIGAVEQLQHARTRLSWCEAENRSLRQNMMREELEAPFRTPGLPPVVRGVAHDFSNLLEAAGTSATGVYAQPNSPLIYREAMDGVMDQAQELLECLMDLTEPLPTTWRTEPVDLDVVVNKALKAAVVPLREPQIQVRVRIGGLEPVWAHHALVFRALVNLIWNAVQAMPNGGLLSIIGYVRADRVVLEVGDTGVGIEAQNRKKVLQESFSTKKGHGGTGLTLVRELIEKCGGEITFSSRPRQGSLFSIALPIAKSGRPGELVRHNHMSEVSNQMSASVPAGRSSAGSHSVGKGQNPFYLPTLG